MGAFSSAAFLAVFGFAVMAATESFSFAMEVAETATRKRPRNAEEGSSAVPKGPKRRKNVPELEYYVQPEYCENMSLIVEYCEKGHSEMCTAEENFTDLKDEIAQKLAGFFDERTMTMVKSVYDLGYNIEKNKSKSEAVPRINVVSKGSGELVNQPTGGGNSEESRCIEFMDNLRSKADRLRPKCVKIVDKLVRDVYVISLQLVCSAFLDWLDDLKKWWKVFVADGPRESSVVKLRTLNFVSSYRFLKAELVLFADVEKNSEGDVAKAVRKILNEGHVGFENKDVSQAVHIIWETSVFAAANEKLMEKGVNGALPYFAFVFSDIPRPFAVHYFVDFLFVKRLVQTSTMKFWMNRLRRVSAWYRQSRHKLDTFREALKELNLATRDVVHSVAEQVGSIGPKGGSRSASTVRRTKRQ